MSLPPSYLKTKLTNILHTTDNGALVTIGDASRYMTILPKHREMRQTWQRVCQLILDQAAPAEITHQDGLALFMDAKLDLRRTA